MTNELTLLIMLDALRFDYLSRKSIDFIADLMTGGISGRLVPSFGFEPDAAYLAGLTPEESDGGAHFWKKPEASPFKFTQYLPGYLERLGGFPAKVSRKILTRFVRLNKRYRYESMPSAPYEILQFFAPSPKLFPPGARGSNIKDIFYLCNEAQIPFFFHGSPQYRVNVEAGAARIEDSLFPPIKFAFWHVGDLDHAGHRFGPDSEKLNTVLLKIDSEVSAVISLLKKRYACLHIVIIGDHGMVKVRNHLDLPGHFSSLGVKSEDMPLYFLDSTMARFWFDKESQRKFTMDALQKLPGGRILTQADLDAYHINYTHNRFGDLLFLAEPGTLFSPNYFQGRSTIKGMHGYAPECPDQQTAFIINSPDLKESQRGQKSIDMRRVFPTLIKLLGIKGHASRLDSII